MDLFSIILTAAISEGASWVVKNTLNAVAGCLNCKKSNENVLLHNHEDNTLNCRRCGNTATMPIHVYPENVRENRFFYACFRKIGVSTPVQNSWIFNRGLYIRPYLDIFNHRDRTAMVSVTLYTPTQEEIVQVKKRVDCKKDYVFIKEWHNGETWKEGTKSDPYFSFELDWLLANTRARGENFFADIKIEDEYFRPIAEKRHFFDLK